jgi:hypothetical protein
MRAHTLTRRHFLVTTAMVGGGFVLHGAIRTDALAQSLAGADPIAINAWVKI